VTQKNISVCTGLGWELMNMVMNLQDSTKGREFLDHLNNY